MARSWVRSAPAVLGVQRMRRRCAPAWPQSVSTHSAGTLNSNTQAIQQRTLRLLFMVQVIGGVGIAVGGSVGALLAAEMTSVSVSGLAQSAVVIGAALLAIPMTAI